MEVRSNYPRFGIAVHWATVVLVVLAYALVELKSLAARGSDLRLAMLRVHYAAGVAVLALTAIRMAWRPFSRLPPIEPLPPRGTRIASALFVVLLYAFLLGLPLLGWMALTAKGEPVPMFGFQLLLLPIDLDEGLARPLRAWHERIADLGYFVIAVHAAAALVHHYLLRDDALSRMLPLMHARGSR